MAQPSPSHHRSTFLPRPLTAFLATLLTLTLGCLAALLRAHILNGRFRSFEPLAPPGAGYDFFVYQDRLPLAHQAAFFTHAGYPWTYPAPAAFLYAFLYSFCFHRLWIWGWSMLLLLSIAGYTFAAVRLSKAAGHRLAGLFFLFTLFCGWPAYISVQRGNIESLIFLLLAAGVWAFSRGHGHGAAALIGIAGACKLYPLLFLGLFVPGKQWKALATGLGVAVLLSVAALWYLNPNVLYAYRQVALNLHFFTQQYAWGLGRGAGIYDHSAFEVVKTMVQPTAATIQAWLRGYMVTAGGLALALYVLRIRKLPVVNQVLFLALGCVFLPPASFDYTLQILYIPFAWTAVLLFQRSLPASRGVLALMILFGMEFAPLTVFKLQDVSVNGVLKGFGLLGMTGVCAWFPLRAATSRVAERQADLVVS